MGLILTTYPKWSFLIFRMGQAHSIRKDYNTRGPGLNLPNSVSLSKSDQRIQKPKTSITSIYQDPSPSWLALFRANSSTSKPVRPSQHLTSSPSTRHAYSGHTTHTVQLPQPLQALKSGRLHSPHVSYRPHQFLVYYRDPLQGQVTWNSLPSGFLNCRTARLVCFPFQIHPVQENLYFHAHEFRRIRDYS